MVDESILVIIIIVFVLVTIVIIAAAVVVLAVEHVATIGAIVRQRSLLIVLVAKRRLITLEGLGLERVDILIATLAIKAVK